MSESILKKVCACCGIEKDRTDFGKKVSNKDGLYSYCKVCKKEFDSEYYLSNRDKVLATVKRRSLGRKQELKDYLKQYCILNFDRIKQNRSEFKKNNLNAVLLRAAKHRAKKLGLDFNIELSDVVVPDICPILHIRLETAKGSPSSNSPSLDRIDPLKGYIKGNVQVISYKANTMKSNANLEDLILFSGWVIDNFLKEHNDNTML